MSYFELILTTKEKVSLEKGLRILLQVANDNDDFLEASILRDLIAKTISLAEKFQQGGN